MWASLRIAASMISILHLPFVLNFSLKARIAGLYLTATIAGKRNAFLSAAGPTFDILP